jgi:magnesium-transporting ATPase (P-type)
LENPDIVLLRGSIIMTGSCKAIVCAVGDHTLYETELVHENLLIEEKETPLQKKLKQFGDQISKLAYVAAIMIFVLLVVYWAIGVMVSSEPLISSYSLTILITDF